MSYSFGVKGATKAEAIEAGNAKLDEVQIAQPVHAADIPAVKDAVAAFANALMDDDTCDVTLSVSGSVYMTGEGLRQVSLSLNAGFSPPRAG